MLWCMHFMGYFIAMFYATLDCLLNTADTKNLSAVARQIIRTFFCKDARNNRIGAAAKIFLQMPSSLAMCPLWTVQIACMSRTIGL